MLYTVKRYGLLTVFIVVLISSCDFPPTFGPEYRDATINFIKDLTIMAPPPATDTGTAVLLDTPALWDWGWRGRTGNTYEYMALTTSAEPGPDAQSTPWILQIVNLAADPACTTLNDWQAVGSEASIQAQSALHGTALKINAAQQSYILAKNSLFADIDTNPKSYRLSLFAFNAYSLKFFNGTSYQNTDLQNPGWTQNGFYTVPFLFSNISTVISSSIAAIATSGSDVFIDEIHLIRADIDLHQWSLRIILGQKDTSPDLVSGQYKFSLYIKKPGGYTFPHEDARSDSVNYAVQFITLRVIQLSDNSTLAEHTFDVSALSSGWEKITIQFPAGKTLQVIEGTTAPILALEIIPLSLQTPFTGAILIAEPELNFFINGY